MERLSFKSYFKLYGKRIANNTLLFVLAYLLVFYAVQAVTVFGAFTHGVSVKIYTSCIDFDSLNTAASQDVWASPDNVISVFGMPIMAIVLLATIATLLLSKWKSRHIQINRFLWWIVICSFVRIGSNFISGHLFHLWNINLVTDFLGITFPSQAGKYLFLAFVVILIIVGFYCSASLTKHITNPFGGRISDEITSNLLIPGILGCVVLNLFFIPYKPVFSYTEVFCTGILLVGIVSISVIVPKRYSFVEKSDKPMNDDPRVNPVILIVVLTMLVVIKIVLDNGLLLQTSPYRNYFLENMLMVVGISILVVFAAYLVFYWKRRKQQEAKQIEKMVEEFEPLKHIIPDEQWGVKKYDVSKYKDDQD